MNTEIPSSTIENGDDATRLRTRCAGLLPVVRPLLMAVCWTGCLCAGVGGARLIRGTSEVLYIYVFPLTCTAMVVSLQLVLMRHSHQWLFGRCIASGGIMGIFCMALLWGPLIICRGYVLPQFPYPPLLLSVLGLQLFACMGVVIYGLTSGGFVGAIWSLSARCMQSRG